MTEPCLAAASRTRRAARTLGAALLLTLALGACGSKKPPPVEAVAGPQDALRLGLQSYDDAQFVAAIQLFGKALALYRSIDDSRGQVTALMDLADVALVLGQHARAHGHLAEAERLVQRDGLAQFAPHLALLKCQQSSQAGDAAAARAQCDAVLALEGAAGGLRAGAEVELAKLALADGGDWNALRKRVAAAVEADGRPGPRARLLRLDADAARRAGDLKGARGALERALAIYQAAFARPGIAASHEELAAVARAEERLDAARDHYERALHIRLWMNDGVHGAQVLEGLAAVETQRGDGARAARIQELLDYMRGATNLEWRVVQQKYESL